MSSLLFDEVFLRKLERLTLLSRQTISGQLQGERRSPKRGHSIEFSDFRPYTPGDDFRSIDWNAYARLERFFIKLFIEEQDITVHLLLDASRSMDWGQPTKFDYARQAVGALGYIVLVGLDKVSVTILGSSRPARAFPPIRGKKNAFSLFTFLEMLSADGKDLQDKVLATQLMAFAANITNPGPLVVFSDLMGDGWKEGLNSLAARGFEISLIHILAPDEIDPQKFAAPPLSGDFKLIDSENGSALEITGDLETLERYRQAVEDWGEEWSRYCNSRGLHYVPALTSQAIEKFLFGHLRQRGVLR